MDFHMPMEWRTPKGISLSEEIKKSLIGQWVKYDSPYGTVDAKIENVTWIKGVEWTFNLHLYFQVPDEMVRRKMDPRVERPMDAAERNVYTKIANGEYVSNYFDREFKAALQRLRRAGLIKNHGTRSRPEWKLSEEWKDIRIIIP